MAAARSKILLFRGSDWNARALQRLGKAVTSRNNTGNATGRDALRPDDLGPCCGFGQTLAAGRRKQHRTMWFF